MSFKPSDVLKKFFFLIRKSKFKSCGEGIQIGAGCRFKNPQCIQIGKNFHAGKNLTIEAWIDYKNYKFSHLPSIVIGNNVSVMRNCQLSAAVKISIGNGVLFGDNVFVTDNSHGQGIRSELDISPVDRCLYVKGPVSISDNVWIGRNVCIMPGVTIGKGTIIGANAVVTKNIPAYSIAVGVPAKVVKQIG